ncbi:MAG: hypothetical protein QXY99_01335 [Thermoproteota archaeon]
MSSVRVAVVSDETSLSLRDCSEGYTSILWDLPPGYCLFPIVSSSSYSEHLKFKNFMSRFMGQLDNRFVPMVLKSSLVEYGLKDVVEEAVQRGANLVILLPRLCMFSAEILRGLVRTYHINSPDIVVGSWLRGKVSVDGGGFIKVFMMYLLNVFISYACGGRGDLQIYAPALVAGAADILALMDDIVYCSCEYFSLPFPSAVALSAIANELKTYDVIVDGVVISRRILKTLDLRLRHFIASFSAEKSVLVNGKFER